jgi:GxxExxY protein
MEHAPNTAAVLIAAPQIKATADKIMADLGAGYSECIYQNALFNKLVKLDPSASMERTVPVIYDDEVLGTCRLDIVTKDAIIEVKATRRMPSNVCHQIRKYLVNLRNQDGVQRFGLVINFNQEEERADFIDIDPVPAPSERVYKRRAPTTFDAE